MGDIFVSRRELVERGLYRQSGNQQVLRQMLLVPAVPVLPTQHTQHQGEVDIEDDWSQGDNSRPDPLASQVTSAAGHHPPEPAVTGTEQWNPVPSVTEELAGQFAYLNIHPAGASGSTTPAGKVSGNGKVGVVEQAVDEEEVDWLRELSLASPLK